MGKKRRIEEAHLGGLSLLLLLRGMSQSEFTLFTGLLSGCGNGLGCVGADTSSSLDKLDNDLDTLVPLPGGTSPRGRVFGTNIKKDVAENGCTSRDFCVLNEWSLGVDKYLFGRESLRGTLTKRPAWSPR
jgi:hypothetical protein